MGWLCYDWASASPGYINNSIERNSGLNFEDFDRLYKKFPCHTQVVERTVKLVSESCKIVTDAIKRDGVIKATLGSRRKMPLFNTKQDFVL